MEIAGPLQKRKTSSSQEEKFLGDSRFLAPLRWVSGWISEFHPLKVSHLSGRSEYGQPREENHPFGL